MMTRYITEEEAKALGASLRRARKEAGYTQVQLGEKLGVTAQVVSNWERGVTSPFVDQAVQMADLYGCSIDYLMGRTGERTR